MDDPRASSDPVRGEYHPDTHTYHIYHDWDQPPSVSTIVIRGVAALHGKNSTDIEPLHDVIDPDALNALFQSVSTGNSDRRASVSFPLEGYEVTVYSEGEIVIALPHGRRGRPGPKRAVQLLIEFGHRLLARGRTLLRNLTGP